MPERVRIGPSGIRGFDSAEEAKMTKKRKGPIRDRRTFLKAMAMFGVGGHAFLQSRDARAALYAAKGGYFEEGGRRV